MSNMETFIEVYPLPMYLENEAFGWYDVFKQERILIRKSDILRVYIHMFGEISFVAIHYIDRTKNKKQKRKGMYGSRTCDMNRQNWSYSLASQDFEKLKRELNK